MKEFVGKKLHFQIDGGFEVAAILESCGPDWLTFKVEELNGYPAHDEVRLVVPQHHCPPVCTHRRLGFKKQ